MFRVDPEISPGSPAFSPDQDQKMTHPKAINPENGKTRKPGIFITGAPRSGTTWAGKVFASVPNTLYVHEPFNPFSPCAYSPMRVPEFFYRLDKEKNERELKYMQDLIDIRFRRCSLKLFDLNKPKTVLSRMNYCVKGLLGMAKADRAVIKDPIAIMSADVLSRNLNMKPLFMVREPAACVSSLYIRNWRTDFEPLWKQRDRLSEIIPDEIDQLKLLIDKPDHDMIDNASFVWRFCNSAIINYLKQNSEWAVTRHEDLIEDPIAAFKQLFDKLEIPWNSDTSTFIESLNSTSSDDSSDKEAGEKPDSSGKMNDKEEIPVIFNIKRDLGKIKTVANDRLTSSQQLKIKKNTEDVNEQLLELIEARN